MKVLKQAVYNLKVDRIFVPLTVHVDDRQVGTADNHALTHDEAQSPRAASDDANLALKGEGGESALHVLAATTLHRG